MLAIINATLVMPDHLIPDAALLIENGKIVDFGKRLAVPEHAEVLDVKGLYVGPGLIDIHTHADGTRRFYEDPEACSKTLIRHGVTTALPALYFSLTLPEYLEAVDTIEKAAKAGKFPNFGGYYMEGPYLNPKFGANKLDNPWGGIVRREQYMPLLEKVKDTAKVFCVAPELPGILDFVRDVKEYIPNIVLSVAHAEATPEQIEALMPYGLKLGTHHTNATGTLETFPECRGVCVDETVHYNSEIYAEIISDSLGAHVHPYLQRLILKIKGRDRLILISDGSSETGPPLPGLEDATDLCFDNDGEISGSKMTLDCACRNMMVHTGASLCDVFRFASLNPARLLGWADVGKIKKDNTANFTIVDHWFNVKHTIIKGKVLL